MKTATSSTYPAFALFAFACFALSPQAFAQKVATPTFSPPGGSYCATSVNVTISTTTGGATILYYLTGDTGKYIPPNPATIRVPKVGSLGTATIQAMAFKAGWINSDWAPPATYTYHCGPSPKTKIILIIGGAVLVAVLIWLLKKKLSANRSVNNVSVG